MIFISIMATTLYSSTDLINKQILSNTFNNASNVGGPDPSVDLEGLMSDNAFSLLGSQVSNSEDCSAIYELEYDINHASPPNPVQNNARITKVVIQMQVVAPSAAGSSSVTFANEGPIGFHGGHANASAVLAAEVLPSPQDVSLGTLVELSATAGQNSSDGTGLMTANASLSPAGQIIGFTIDFTTNPGGQYPLGYATFNQFITNFAQMIFFFEASGQGGAQWLGFSPSDHPTPATGSVSGNLSLTVNNFSMEVTWDVPLAWSVTPSTLTGPPFIITISRPDPGVPPDQDTQIIKELILPNGTVIGPNSPWTIIWTITIIIIHLPPDEIITPFTPGGIPIGTQFTGSVPLGTITIIKADLSGMYTFDTTVHHDQLYARSTGTTTVGTITVLIPSPYGVTSFVNDDEEEISHYAGVRVRAVGQGQINFVMQSLDTIYTDILSPLTLLTANATQPFQISNFVNQRAALRFYTQNTDDYMEVSKLIIYTTPIATGYPQ